MQWCSACTKDTPITVTFNDAGQIVKCCSVCGTPVGGGPVTATVARGALTEGGKAAAALVTEAPPERPQAQATVTNIASRRAPTHKAPPAGASAEDIVEQARAQLAALDLEIPELEANLARAKAHRRGLQKMVTAYDKGANERPTTRASKG